MNTPNEIMNIELEKKKHLQANLEKAVEEAFEKALGEGAIDSLGGKINASCLRMPIGEIEEGIISAYALRFGWRAVVISEYVGPKDEEEKVTYISFSPATKNREILDFDIYKNVKEYSYLNYHLKPMKFFNRQSKNGGVA